MEPRDQVLLAGQEATATPADNATATATCTPHVNGGREGRIVLFGCFAFYSASVAALKDITVTYRRPGATNDSTFTFRHDFTLGPLNLPFPGAITCERGTAPTIALAPSGTPGTSGNVTAFYSEH